MPDRDQQVTEAAMEFLAQQERDQTLDIAVFLTTLAPEIRADVQATLELMLALGDVTTPLPAAAVPQAQIDQIGQRVHARYFGQATPATQSITDARKARRLSLGALASRLNLPTDLWTRIERGAVQPDTIPARLITRLAAALQETDSAVRAMLTAPPLAPAVRLSAQSGTQTTAETVVSFQEALRASAATPEQRAEWEHVA